MPPLHLLQQFADLPDTVGVLMGFLPDINRPAPVLMCHDDITRIGVSDHNDLLRL